MSSWPPPQRPSANAMSYISQTRYMPGLDGLRALAVVAVMIYHANHEWLSGGFLGVEVFFVISGYLITLLLIGEHERTDRIDLWQFWKRRFRRLLPALFVMMAVLATYLAVVNRRPQGRTRGDFLGGIFYGSNWYQIVVGQSYTASEAFAPLRHLWSLAVEEQFYLVWPLVMALILRRGRDRLPKVAVWLAGISVAIAIVVAILFVGGDVADECGTGSAHGYATLFGRCINIDDALYLSTFTRAGGLLLGAAFAMWWRPLALLRGPMRDKGRRLDLIALISVALLVVLAFTLSLSGSGSSFGTRYNPWLFRGGFLLVGVATLAVIAAVAHRRALTGRILGNPLFAWIGTRSYGLYLYHWPIYQIIRQQAGLAMTWKQFALAMVITLPITELSYRLVETPFRTGRFKSWLRSENVPSGRPADRHRRRLVAVVAVFSTVLGFAGVSLAVARNVCVGDVECSVEAGAAADGPNSGGPAVVASTVTGQASNSATTVDAVATSDTTGNGSTTTAVPSTTATTTVAETTTIAQADTTAATTTATTPAVDIATTSAPTTVPATVLATTAPAATTAATTAPVPSGIQPIALGESVMLGAITNLQTGGFYVDALKGRQGPEMATLVETLRTNNQIGSVVVIQIGTNGSVSAGDFQRIMAQLTPDLTPTVVFLTVRVPKSWQDGNNELIRALPAQYPNVTVLDWQVASMSTSLCKDGTHIACGGGAAQFYTNLIFDAVGRPDLKR